MLQKYRYFKKSVLITESLCIALSAWQLFPTRNWKWESPFLRPFCNWSNGNGNSDIETCKFVGTCTITTEKTVNRVGEHMQHPSGTCTVEKSRKWTFKTNRLPVPLAMWRRNTLWYHAQGMFGCRMSYISALSISWRHLLYVQNR